MWKDVLQSSQMIQSIPLSSQSPLSDLFLLDALTVQIAEQCQDQSSMVGNQKAWKENTNQLFKKPGFSSLWKVVLPHLTASRSPTQ